MEKKKSVEPPSSETVDVTECSDARVQRECLVFSPHLPGDVSELCVRGVSYLGRRTDWLLRRDEVCVILREQPGGAAAAQSSDLQIVLKASGSRIPLEPGERRSGQWADRVTETEP